MFAGCAGRCLDTRVTGMTHPGFRTAAGSMPAGLTHGHGAGRPWSGNTILAVHAGGRVGYRVHGASSRTVSAFAGALLLATDGGCAQQLRGSAGLVGEHDHVAQIPGAS